LFLKVYFHCNKWRHRGVTPRQKNNMGGYYHSRFGWAGWDEKWGDPINE
jgi:hypothetical protein